MPPCTASAADLKISLAGEWRFAMGAPVPGKDQAALPELKFADTLKLPGTTETNRKGKENPDCRVDGLTRLCKLWTTSTGFTSSA